ncbi:unnamed protein product (macronuclear) [Paramecium tetraurelia]|uniref:Protein kinase domain-containing protein n=1 Tax=Paramecium tetraurelia TaxID=5888 RepID=A0E7G7_PARTE|nr:uncharacterized protein GSPATT00023962001 [Paramecium tetraurelia]CAK91234.1 unnamed protein product [Paramecium tetraurelia]|eukprot:XP_001458631.1 hypothetical protein (macronuclear) [Paramecium tetraurelia strain d4-2]
MQLEGPISFEFNCFKKGQKGTKQYKGISNNNKLDLYKENAKAPKYSLPIQLQTHIKWEVEEEIVNGKKHYKIVSFKFQQIKQIRDSQIAKVTCFFGDDVTLSKLKEHLRNKIIFQRIQDFYTPLQTLGKGASSRVLLVRHKNSELYYAAKCVDKSYVNETENGIESMFQEISINNDLDHPSFIKLHAVYEGDNTFYMVMDLLEGKSLHDELNSHKNGFPEEIVRNVMWQILTGIEYMHKKNIMHRDLKPENIMLQRKSDLNSLKIVDFGLATYCNIDKYLFPKCGTPGYVAPEIANLIDKSEKYDKVCDVFSAGVIFFKLLTGKDLFPGVGFNLVLKLNKQCKIDLTPLQMKKVDPSIINLIQRMLEKDPTKRISASACLLEPFFEKSHMQFQELKLQQTSTQKKQFFSSGGKNFQTQEFQSDSPQIQNTKQIDKGSFVTQDCAFKGFKEPQHGKVMQKFNTTEFDHVDPNINGSPIEKKNSKFTNDQIEEEDEK